MKKETNIILKELNKMSLLDYVKHLTKIKNLIDGLKNGSVNIYMYKKFPTSLTHPILVDKKNNESYILLMKKI